MTMTNYVNAYATKKGTKKKTTTTMTPPPLLWMLALSPRLRTTKELPLYQQTAQGGILPPDVSSTGSTFHHRTSGSSRASSLATGTTTGCNFRNNVATPSTISPSLPPHTVLTQPLEGEERDTGWGEASTSQRQPRQAAQKQRELLSRLLRDDLL